MEIVLKDSVYVTWVGKEEAVRAKVRDIRDIMIRLMMLDSTKLWRREGFHDLKFQWSNTINLIFHFN